MVNLSTVLRSIYGKLILAGLLCAAAWLWLVPPGSNRPPAATVEGNVTLDGRPLDHAVIEFISLDPVRPIKASAEISHGSFRIDADRGPALGRNRVEVFTYLGPLDVADAADPSSAKAPGKLRQVPERYSVLSDLNADVTQDGPNHFTFALTSDSQP